MATVLGDLVATINGAMILVETKLVVVVVFVVGIAVVCETISFDDETKVDSVVVVFAFGISAVAAIVVVDGIVDDEPKVDSVAALLTDVIAVFVGGMVVVARSFVIVVVIADATVLVGVVADADFVPTAVDAGVFATGDVWFDDAMVV